MQFKLIIHLHMYTVNRILSTTRLFYFLDQNIAMHPTYRKFKEGTAVASEHFHESGGIQ